MLVIFLDRAPNLLREYIAIVRFQKGKRQNLFLFLAVALFGTGSLFSSSEVSRNECKAEVSRSTWAITRNLCFGIFGVSFVDRRC